MVCFACFVHLLELYVNFLTDGANSYSQPDHEITRRLSISLDPRQLSSVAEYDVVNHVSVENGGSHIAPDDSHIVGQSLSDPSDLIKSPCVLHSVYSLSVQ